MNIFNKKRNGSTVPTPQPGFLTPYVDAAGVLHLIDDAGVDGAVAVGSAVTAASATSATTATNANHATSADSATTATTATTATSATTAGSWTTAKIITIAGACSGTLSSKWLVNPTINVDIPSADTVLNGIEYIPIKQGESFFRTSVTNLLAFTKASLATSTGASTVGFIQPTAGAVLRTIQAKVGDYAINIKDFGAISDGVSDDSTAVLNATSAATALTGAVHVAGTVNAPTATIDKVADVAFMGQGSLSGVYRKRVIPFNSSSDALFSQDIDPTKHLKQFNRACSGVPTVVLMGDSISTYFANSVSRGDMLADVLHRKLDTISPNGINFYNRSIGGMSWTSVTQVQYQTYIPWYDGYTTTTWLDMVKMLSPDLLVLSFGMNDSSNISTAAVKTVIDAIQAWPKVPSIVLCTGLIPNPQSTTYPEGRTGQEGREWAAGFIRSYANFRNLGLLDFNRKVTMVRDGFDIFSSCLTKPVTLNVTAAGWDVLGTTECIDWKIRVAVDPTILVNDTWFTVKTGPGANDFVQVYRVSATKVQFNMYAGSSDSLGLSAVAVDFTWPTVAGYAMVIEKVGNYISVYTDTDSQYGCFNAPIYFAKVVSLGGVYFPLVHPSVAGAIPYCDIGYGEFKTNIPSVKNSLLWGNETPSAIDVHGGSGYNHPSGFMATHVYRPVIDSANWGQARPQVGTVMIASGTTTVTVSLTNAELDANYNVLLSTEGLSLGSYVVTSKAVQSFIITFTAATTQAGTIVYQLVRV